MTGEMASEESPKRTRRSKAEMEEARAAGLEPAKKEQAPKRPAGTKISIAYLKQTLAGAITLIDRTLIFLAPALWQPDDTLSPQEVGLLATAGANELARYPKAVEWLGKAGQLSGHAQLVYAVAVISAPRMARRGIIPVEVANGLIAGPLVAGPAPSDNRANGNG